MTKEIIILLPLPTAKFYPSESTDNRYRKNCCERNSGPAGERNETRLQCAVSASRYRYNSTCSQTRCRSCKIKRQMCTSTSTASMSERLEQFYAHFKFSGCSEEFVDETDVPQNTITLRSAGTKESEVKGGPVRGFLYRPNRCDCLSSYSCSLLD